VALGLYLDDCAFSHSLARLLRQAGHTVTTPADAGLTGSDDDVHFAYAVHQGLIVLTKNPADFHDLHELNENHPGILAVHQDNDVSKDMSDPEIVQAIASLEAVYAQTNTPLANEFHDLNQWRVSIPPASAAPPVAAPPPPPTHPAQTPKGAAKKGGGNK
jgi:predicted nuclease of predicted toxin-antitoxin system